MRGGTKGRGVPSRASKGCTISFYCIILLTLGWGFFLYYKPLSVVETSVAHGVAQLGSSLPNIRRVKTDPITISDKLFQDKRDAYTDVLHINSATVAPSIAQESTVNKIAASQHNDLHIVFSTDCSPYQDWQSLLVFHSAHQVGQTGLMTRIASGCDELKKVELKALYQKLWGSTYLVHFTPGMSYYNVLYFYFH